MAGHNVVLTTCPDAMTGQVNVGFIVGPLFKTFTNIRMTLLVGIAGGVPQKNLFSDPLKDVRLGDVVVGWPRHADNKAHIVYWDAGRLRIDGFQTTTQLNRPHMVLLQAITSLSRDRTLGRSNFQEHLVKLQSHPDEELAHRFKHPGLEHDLLFEPTYEHAGDYNSQCRHCDKERLVGRQPRPETLQDNMVFHQGRIATGELTDDGRH